MPSMRKRYTATSLVPFSRCGFDRRCREDRRQSIDLDYFDAGGVERRKGKERRNPVEKREGWLRYTNWSSVYVGD